MCRLLWRLFHSMSLSKVGEHLLLPFYLSKAWINLWCARRGFLAMPSDVKCKSEQTWCGWLLNCSTDCRRSMQLSIIGSRSSGPKSWFQINSRGVKTNGSSVKMDSSPCGSSPRPTVLCLDQHEALARRRLRPEHPLRSSTYGSLSLRLSQFWARSRIRNSRINLQK